ncbi:MAG TPA: hypothetical protein VG820_09395, partial [Fimbriimonadaceae bacterium]|nr:hypothetical protein [Fimbriimonadaceae bacterium]
YKRTLDLDANPAWTWDSLARVYGELGMKPEFKGAIEELRQYDSDEADSLTKFFDADQRQAIVK